MNSNANSASPACPLAHELAKRLRVARAEITQRWLDRIAARVSVAPNHLFPSHELLDHVPLLVDGVASFVEDPAADVATDPPVIAKAMELGGMRYEQGFDAYEIFKEYEILGSVLFHFLASVADEIDQPCTREELLYCGQRVFQAVTLIQQATSMQFLRETQTRMRDREDRLRGFNRMVSHELKNRVGAATGAVGLLSESWIDEKQRGQFLGIASTNLDAIQNVLEDLASLSRLDEDLRQQRNVRLGEAVAEVRRRLRDFARSHNVDIEVEEPLPPIEVNAAAIELSLTNYISNAVKYSDPAKPSRWVKVRAHLVERTADDRTGRELVVEVADNGVGVPPDAQASLFSRFYRAHKDSMRTVEGTGLGLSIVRETVSDLGGRAWMESTPGQGSVFSFSLPADRSAETRDISPVRRLGGEQIELRR